MAGARAGAGPQEILPTVLKHAFAGAVVERRDRKRPMKKESSFENNPGFFRDLLQFVAASGKWWLVPMVVVFVLFGALLILGGTSAAPFIYTLF
jgi:hypothetical protein